MSKGIGGEIVMEDDEPEKPGCFIREDVGKQPVLTGVVFEPSTCHVETTGATKDEIERDALILDLAGRLIEELKIRNHPPETLRRVIKHRLPRVFSVVNSIVAEEEVCMTTGPMFVGPIH